MSGSLNATVPKVIPINDPKANGASYVIDQNLRKVTPYEFVYSTYTKERWIGRTLLDVFSKEFRDKDEEYYRRKIVTGQVTVNGKTADMGTVLKNGDLILHSTHKHESPVSSRPIKVVHEDDNLVVVDKPAGMPAHPTGRFNYNSVVSVLKYEHGIICHPVNRLDRLTSGLMFLAKSPAHADKFSAQIRDRTVVKEYVALVVGEFPVGEEIVCSEPLSTVRPKIALNMVDLDEGKPSTTKFSCISTNGKTSIVKCMPLTGRTHQIRVHLQYLGYPIANDPIYSNPHVWGPTLGKGVTAQSANVDELAESFDKIGKTIPSSSWITKDGPGDGEVLNGEVCPECDQPIYTDPSPNALGLYLHAMRYSAKDGSWHYETSPPEWFVDEHLPYLQKALLEAEKSPPLPTNFSVGACLVHKGVVLETGYTNELPGNTHAEQCALEKYRSRTNEQDVPSGTAIYTTMEPCTFRLSGNLPCADRILATSINTVFVGAPEPADFVADNDGRSKLEARGIHYIRIPGLEEDVIRVAKRGHIQN